MYRSVGAVLALGMLAAGACGGEGETPRAEADAGSAEPGVQGAAAASTGVRGATPLDITAVVGDDRYQVSGAGECLHTDDASIYDVPAALWAARYRGDGEITHLNLTVWEPKAGTAPQVTLSLGLAEAEHQIATVEKGRRAGSGTATVLRSGGGGTLSVKGMSEDGTPVQVSATCPSFTVPVAEGG